MNVNFFKCLLIILLIPTLYSQTRYELKCPENLINGSYKILLEQVGKLETGNNRGIADIYNRSIGNPLGSPYCQAGQYYCYLTAAHKLGNPSMFLPLPRNGLANSTFDNAKRKGIKTRYAARKHDFIIWKSIYNYTGHIERIVEVRKGGWVKTVGFNTGSKSEDNGEGVCYKMRNINFPLSRIKQIRGLVGIK